MHKYAIPNIGAAPYIRQMLTTKGETDCNMVIAGDFNTTLTTIDTPATQKINEETQALNHTVDQMVRLIASGHFIKKQQNSPFSQMHMEHSPENILGYKFTKIKIISSIFSDHSAMR